MKLSDCSAEKKSDKNSAGDNDFSDEEDDH